MGRRLALLIGSSTYVDPKLRRLHKPDADVASLASVLRDPAIGGFDDVQTYVDANVAILQRAVAALFAHKHTDDLLLLYFAGHGIKDEYGHLHLAAGDTDSELLSATALSSDFITREMDRSRSRKQILVLDCCFSGAFSGTFAADAVGTTQAFTTDGVGRVILTATDAFQYAWEDEKAITDANSLFTHFLVEGIRSGDADINADGLITADEWYEFVYNSVRAASPKQTPQRSVYSGAGGLLIAHNPRPKVPLPDEIAVAMKSPLPYVREGVAHELSRLSTGEHAGLAAAARDALQLLASDRDQRVRDIAATALRAGISIAEEAPPAAQQNTSSQPIPVAAKAQPASTEPPPREIPPEQPPRPAITAEPAVAPAMSGTWRTRPLDTGRFVFIVIVGMVVLEAARLLIAAGSDWPVARNHAWIISLALVLLALAGLAIRAWRQYRAQREHGVQTVVILLALAVLLGIATIVYTNTRDAVIEVPQTTDTGTSTDTADTSSTATDVTNTMATATAAATDTTATTTTSKSLILTTKNTTATATDTTTTTTTSKSLILPTTDYSELVAELHTSAGQIDIRFFPDRSPNHVRNFVGLARKGFYNGTKFSWVSPEGLIQGGDPNTKTGDRSTWKNYGSDAVQEHELSSMIPRRGMVIMSPRQGQDVSDGWQFSIITGNSTFHQRCTVFGEVIQGLAVADAIGSAHIDSEHHPDNPTTLETITFRTEHFKK
jgi:cyclophilin family peptidyl-prolyl cis-trans isomerase